MLELPHALVGAAVATYIPNPIISLPLSLASHFITDLFPHWNPHINHELKTHGRITHRSLIIIITDSLLTFGFILLLLSFNPIAALASFLAIFPDLVEFPHFFLKLKIKPIEKLIKFQSAHQWNVPIFWGILSQLLVIIGCFMLLFAGLCGTHSAMCF